MYPDDPGGGDPAMAEDFGGGGIKTKLQANLEGLIPLVLILIILAVAANYLGFVDLPFVGGAGPAKMLIIGQPSLVTQSVLDADRDLVRYTIRPSSALRASPKETLAQYDIIMLDQSTSFDKSIPRELGEAIESYVSKGGKLIVVKNSGIERIGAIDIIGWKASLSDVVPVECEKLPDGTPSCVQSLFVTGEIWRQDFDHPIMEGIEFVPALPNQPLLQMETFRVSETGNMIAVIKSADTQEFYPAIVEKRLILGKSIYFNYDPGLTPGIFSATLKYLG